MALRWLVFGKETSVLISQIRELNKTSKQVVLRKEKNSASFKVVTKVGNNRYKTGWRTGYEALSCIHLSIVNAANKLRYLHF